MNQFLIGDIGGTHSRFALSDGGDEPHDIHAFANDDVASFQDAIQRYLDATGEHPSTAVLGIAAPVKGRDIALTNRGWRFNLDDLQRQFGFARIRAINDFEAQAWALTRLKPKDLRRIGDAGGVTDGPRVVLGPGTGLGVAALVPDSHGPIVIATEAGHGSFGPADADEDQVFAAMRLNGPVSAETALSGPGLERLHAALNPQAVHMNAEAIDTAAHAGDAAALKTTRLFVKLLGRFAGDMMLVFRATGGVYVTGGVALALGDLIDAEIFRAAFEAHPPYGKMLAKTPSYLVMHPQAGLLGAAAAAASL